MQLGTNTQSKESGAPGFADEVAAQVAFLASPRASFTTGTNVVIDGGLTKRIQY